MSRRTSQPQATTSKTSRGSKMSATGSVSKAVPGSKGVPGQQSSANTSKVKKKEIVPALSVPIPPAPTLEELLKLKKKMIRRNAPPGEDLKCINTILKSIEGKDISVQEFVSLIAPSTGDQGTALREVMNEDLNQFRRLARKVYETITQDNSDVLLNQQLQLGEYYKERKNILNAKMMNAIEEIYEMAGNFDFDRYAEEKEKYLEELFPIPAEVEVEPEEIEAMKRQAAYHRLQWLRSERERLNEENNSLKRRLNQMKRMHKDEQQKMVEMEKEAEETKKALEAQQAEKREQLEELNDSLEKSIIEQEKDIRRQKDKDIYKPVPSKAQQVKKKKSKPSMKRIRRPKWNDSAACEVDCNALDEGRTGEFVKIMGKPPPQPRQLSPFHYSPPRAQYSPPGAQQQPPQQVQPVSAGGASQVSTDADSTPARLPPTRKRMAPRDTWGGFY